ncbi:MAG: hypothetical protein RQ757_11580 [Pseudomonadales bacterium]|nr:hypothetical protein [Pseudomonadales bacterium]
MTRTRRFTMAMFFVAASFSTHEALAQIEGVYHSDGGDDCTLTISAMDEPEAKFGDAFYRLESRGLAACMWDGAGLSSSTNLVGGYVSLPPVNNRVYFTIKWLFGPSSNSIEIEQRNPDGGLLLKSTYTRQ